MATILLPTSALKPGMTVAESVCCDRQVILQENTVLTSNIIRRLATWHVHSVRVNQEPSYEDGAQSIANLSAEFIKDNPAFFEQYGKAITTAGKLFHLMRERQTVPFQELRQLATVNLYNLLRNKGLLGNLYRLKSYTDYTFMHAVDVGLLSGLLAMWNGLPEEEVKNLILCGVMHDIGKSQIPLAILDKPGKLTPEERKTIVLHPEYGYYMTKSIPGITPDVQYAVWHHHERESGEGYPGQLRGDRIHPYAKIVAIADTYDALTTDKPTRKASPPSRRSKPSRTSCSSTSSGSSARPSSATSSTASWAPPSSSATAPRPKCCSSPTTCPANPSSPPTKASSPTSTLQTRRPSSKSSNSANSPGCR